MAFLGGIGFTEITTISLVAGLILLFPIFVLVSALRATFQDSTTKLMWVLVILFLPFIGPLLYLIIGRNQRIA
ncbi:PLDc N-terminal domain-containing protein [Rudanella lutea]|uniref:PLDc N-terminal domain-containing protein n=1 Tax=Rudanella lutea TaxID=451374 RepID=UPI00035CB7DF|nr:PLDc N-terminal domain-containing protein [Rudanella lutea]